MVQKSSTTALVLLLASTCSLAQPAFADETRDNSGRQLAVVVPGMPHPAPVMPVKPQAANGSPWSADSADAAIKEGMNKLSSIQVPVKLSPDQQAAVDKGIETAEGLSRIALRRVTDFSTWIGVLLRDMNSVPRVSPVTSPAVPVLANSSDMRPIADPGKGRHQLIYTSEQRLRTVVGR